MHIASPCSHASHRPSSTYNLFRSALAGPQPGPTSRTAAAAAAATAPPALRAAATSGLLESRCATHRTARDPRCLELAELCCLATAKGRAWAQRAAAIFVAAARQYLVVSLDPSIYRSRMACRLVFHVQRRWVSWQVDGRAKIDGRLHHACIGHNVHITSIALAACLRLLATTSPAVYMAFLTAAGAMQASRICSGWEASSSGSSSACGPCPAVARPAAAWASQQQRRGSARILAVQRQHTCAAAACRRRLVAAAAAPPEAAAGGAELVVDRQGYRSFMLVRWRSWGARMCPG